MELFFYSFYLTLSILIIYQVGEACYKSGQIFVKALFPHKLNFSTSVNKNLKLAYYLVNVGYLFFYLNKIENLPYFEIGLEFLTQRLATNFIMIGVLHFINIISILTYYKLKKTKSLWKTALNLQVI